MHMKEVNAKIIIGRRLLCGRCARHEHCFGSTMAILNWEILNQLPNIRDGVPGTRWENGSPKGNAQWCFKVSHSKGDDHHIQAGMRTRLAQGNGQLQHIRLKERNIGMQRAFWVDLQTKVGWALENLDKEPKLACSILIGIPEDTRREYRAGVKRNTN